MKRGYVDRKTDISGVSGTGNVAEFAIASDGRLVIFWPKGVGYHASLEDAIEVHGHGGETQFVILDDEEETHCTDCHKYAKYVGFVCTNHKSDTCPGCLAGVS